MASRRCGLVGSRDDRCADGVGSLNPSLIGEPDPMRSSTGNVFCAVRRDVSTSRPNRKKKKNRQMPRHLISDAHE